MGQAKSFDRFIVKYRDGSAEATDANHEPNVSVREAHRSARPGETVRLEGTVSDPDQDAVAVRWWRWKDVDRITSYNVCYTKLLRSNTEPARGPGR